VPRRIRGPASRGGTELGDYQAALRDYQRAATLYGEQGNTDAQQAVLDAIDRLQAGTPVP